MTVSGDRLQDVRYQLQFNIDSAAIDYVAEIGPAAWAVYCYLVSRASAGDTRWPSDLEIASACGISTYNARRSVERLIEHHLIGRHRWLDRPNAPATFAVLPIPTGEDREVEGPAEPAPPETIEAGAETVGDEEEPLRREAAQRRQTRELFSRLTEALGIDPGLLSEEERTRMTEASRIARDAGATPEEVGEVVEQLRRIQPDQVLDATGLLEYWRDLFRVEE